MRLSKLLRWRPIIGPHAENLLLIRCRCRPFQIYISSLVQFFFKMRSMSLLLVYFAANVAVAAPAPQASLPCKNPDGAPCMALAGAAPIFSLNMVTSSTSSAPIASVSTEEPAPPSSSAVSTSSSSSGSASSLQLYQV